MRSIENSAYDFRPPQNQQRSRIILGLLLSLLAIGGATVGIGAIWLPRTLSYEVGEEQLVLHSGFRMHPSSRSIDLGNIKNARAVQLERGKRRNGSSLPGYCVGHFRFPSLGSVDLYTNCSRGAVILEIAGASRPLVLSPKNRDAFLQALGGQGHYHEEFHPGESGSGSWKVLRVFLPLAVLPLLIIPIIFFISPRKLRYRISPQHVEIHTLIGVKRFSIGNCFAQLLQPRSSLKLMGSSLPGYYAGRFRVDGMNTRVYATNMKEGVLIEGPDLRLYLNPEDPQAFLQALKSYGNIEVHQETG